MAEPKFDIPGPRVEDLGDAPGTPGSAASGGNGHEQQSASTIDNATVQRQLEDMTAAFQNLNHEVIQLRAQARDRQEAPQSSTAAGAPPVGGSSASATAPQAQPVSVVPAPHSKEQKPRDQPPYHGESEGEHIRWFQNVRIEFLACPSYFLDDRAKILWCMRFLKGDPQSQWFTRTKDGEDLEGISYDYFKSFLLNLVADPVNRRLTAYENWERARQRSDQKVSGFKSELEEYEAHLPPFEEVHRVNFFFCKLLPSLKEKLLGIGEVPTTREDLFAKAIMLEKTLERERRTGGNSSNNPNSNNRKGGKGKNKAQQQSQQQQQGQSNQNTSNDNGRNTRAGSKRKRQGEEDISKVQCYGCGRMGHYKSSCAFKSEWPAYEASVAAVEANAGLKNNQASLTPRKRSKKGQ